MPSDSMNVPLVALASCTSTISILAIYAFAVGGGFNTFLSQRAQESQSDLKSSDNRDVGLDQAITQREGSGIGANISSASIAASAAAEWKRQLEVLLYM